MKSFYLILLLNAILINCNNLKGSLHNDENVLRNLQSTGNTNDFIALFNNGGDVEITRNYEIVANLSITNFDRLYSNNLNNPPVIRINCVVDGCRVFGNLRQKKIMNIKFELNFPQSNVQLTGIFRRLTSSQLYNIEVNVISDNVNIISSYNAFLVDQLYLSYLFNIRIAFSNINVNGRYFGTLTSWSSNNNMYGIYVKGNSVICENDFVRNFGSVVGSSYISNHTYVIVQIISMTVRNGTEIGCTYGSIDDVRLYNNLIKCDTVYANGGNEIGIITGRTEISFIYNSFVISSNIISSGGNNIGAIIGYNKYASFIDNVYIRVSQSSGNNIGFVCGNNTELNLDADASLNIRSSVFYINNDNMADTYINRQCTSSNSYYINDNGNTNTIRCGINRYESGSQLPNNYRFINPNDRSTLYNELYPYYNSEILVDSNNILMNYDFRVQNGEINYDYSQFSITFENNIISIVGKYPPSFSNITGRVGSSILFSVTAPNIGETKTINMNDYRTFEGEELRIEILENWIYRTFTTSDNTPDNNNSIDSTTIIIIVLSIIVVIVLIGGIIFVFRRKRVVVDRKYNIYSDSEIEKPKDKQKSSKISSKEGVRVTIEENKSKPDKETSRERLITE